MLRTRIAHYLAPKWHHWNPYTGPRSPSSLSFSPRLNFQIHTNQQQSDGHTIVGYNLMLLVYSSQSHFFGLDHRQYPKPETLTCNWEKCKRGHAMPSDGNCYGCQETCRGKYTGMSVREDISSVYQFTGHTEGHTYQDRIMKHCHPKYVMPVSCRTCPAIWKHS